MEKSGGLHKENERKTTAMGYRRRKAVVGFKWKTLVVGGELQVEHSSGRLTVVASNSERQS